MNEYFAYQILYNQYLIMEEIAICLFPHNKASKSYLESIREAKEHCAKQMNEILKDENDGFTRSPETADS